MKYEFEYFKVKGKEKELELEANTDEEAVKLLFDKVGICEFGCIKANGETFNDEDYLKVKELIAKGY